MLVIRRVVTLRETFEEGQYLARYFFKNNLQRNTFFHQRIMCTASQIFREQSNVARQIFLAAVERVKPSELVKSKVSLENNILRIDGKQEISLEEFKNCYVVGFGKAVLPMAEQIVSILGSKCTSCIVSVPEGTRASSFSKIEVHRGARNNIPDENAALAASKILDLVNSCQVEDLLIVLISGGGSALLPVPKTPITITEKGDMIRRLSTAGATINELNTVRTQLSDVKGGGLVKHCSAKKVISLILSDVLGDPLNIIASGPTILPTLNTVEPTPWDIIKKYIPNDHDIPLSIQKVLSEPNSSLSDNRQDSSRFMHFIIGNNQLALTAAQDSIDSSKYVSCILTCQLEGEARIVGEKLSVLAQFVAATLHNTTNELKADDLAHLLETTLNLNSLNIDASSATNMYNAIITAKQQGRKICLLLGGETVCHVKGTGIGGRNQELALAAAIKLHEMFLASDDSENKERMPIITDNNKITILSCGTDGIDGPCPAAGAVVNVHTVEDAVVQNMDPMKSLQNNDSYTFFENVSNGLYQICTGHTGTNVMDVIVILVD